ATLHDWDMLGYALGGMLPPHAVPVFTGEFPRPNTITLKTFFASLACAAGTEMCHIPGITPEAPDKNTAFQGKTGYPVIEVTPANIRAAFERINTGVRGSGSIDYITIGCPHLHVDELREISGFLEGKKIHPDVCLDIWTTGPMKYMAERCGYAAVIKNSGGNLLTGGCPSNRGYPEGVKGVAMDATKQRQDTPAHFDGSRIFLGSRQACLEAAIRGRWE
ncbi:MAG: aconitase X catalytic domain-containing protein, partial [Desulfobacterales bacterium]|nr:aconitase X catalytic domain-containing protein [Desulfobacterales bacterium]